MTQPNSPENQQENQWGTQQQSAPSAYSAPGAAPFDQQAYAQQYPQQAYAPQGYPQQAYGQPAYGQPYGYQAPSQTSGLGAFFSLDFSQKFGAKIAKLIMIFAFVVAGAIAIAALFSLITTLSMYGVTAMMVFSAIFVFIRDAVFALFILGITRVILETTVKDEGDESDAA